MTDTDDLPARLRDEAAEHRRILGNRNSDAEDAMIEAASRIEQLEALVAMQREALEIIAGQRQCVDNLMSNEDVARAALGSSPGAVLKARESAP